MYGAGRSRITHPFATLTQEQAPGIPFDLHVLSTPPAFVLSQDQTLYKMVSKRTVVRSNLHRAICHSFISPSHR